MIHLDLDPREAHTLRRALETYLAELHSEIAHTDSSSYREGLKERQDVLERVTQQLAEEDRAAATH